MTNAIVSVTGLRMAFGRRTVINDLSFDVHPGETFGLLGSNGSGKTTTIRALLGMLPATAGTLHLAGRPYSPRTGIRVGYLPEERGLYRKERVLDVMCYFGRLKGLSRRDARSFSLNYLHQVGLADKAGARLDTLSGGQQQKVQLGVTIMDRPELLILDEPTKGLDPVNRNLLDDIVDEAKAAGATVILVSHNMDEVERSCDRILLLKDGTARAYGQVSEIQDAAGATIAALEFTGRRPGTTWSVNGTTATRVLQPGEDPADLLTETLACGVSVTGFTVRRPSLHEIFLTTYDSEAR